MQLVTILNDWTSMLDNGLQIDTFVLDFEKAFDTVSHELLKSKLHSYGVSNQTLNWISAFLSNRTQSVVVNGTKSKSANVISGVSQGTVLGPVLFIAYINDIASNINFEIRLFADDCICYKVIHSISDCVNLQQDINALGKWARDWGMSFQPVKCNMIRFSKKRTNILYDYRLEGTTLEFHDDIKYLGVRITNNLNWNKHITEICNKAYKTLGLLRRKLSACPQDVKMQAYNGLIRPVLEYTSFAWDQPQQYLQDKLENIQERSARFIANNYIYKPGEMTAILKNLKLPSLKTRRKQN